jgi:hypothetical protein
VNTSPRGTWARTKGQRSRTADNPALRTVNRVFTTTFLADEIVDLRLAAAQSMTMLFLIVLKRQSDGSSKGAMVDESDAAQAQVQDDLNMLRTGGRARRESELRELFATAELRVTKRGATRARAASSEGCDEATVTRTDAPLELANRWPYANCIEILALAHRTGLELCGCPKPFELT